MTETWACEECRAPWPQEQSQCQRCGNRTRVPVLPDPPNPFDTVPIYMRGAAFHRYSL